MCYHTESPTVKQLREIVPEQVEIAPYPELTFVNGFDKPLVPVLKSDNQNVVGPWPWSGFVIPGQKFNLTTLNARSESVFESRLYGSSIRSRRCLMFVKGFFEWSPVGGTTKNKVPYYIDRIDGQAFAMAGIWKDWGMVNGEPHRSLSIVTTDANELLTQLRPDTPRLTLILEQNKWDQWLDPNASEAAVKELFQVYPDGLLKAKKLAVSPLKKEKPKPTNDKPQQELF